MVQIIYEIEISDSMIACQLFRLYKNDRANKTELYNTIKKLYIAYEICSYVCRSEIFVVEVYSR